MVLIKYIKTFNLIAFQLIETFWHKKPLKFIIQILDMVHLRVHSYLIRSKKQPPTYEISGTLLINLHENDLVILKAGKEP